MVTDEQKDYFNTLSDDRKIGLFQERTMPIDGYYQPMGAKEVIDVLGLSIKQDENNKLITFLALLSAYTEDSQLNISFNAPSSSGKSFIPTEIALLFPPEDVIEVAYCSPTAFFHDHGVFVPEKSGYIVDLSRKILIFLDQPHSLLLQHLRPLLSHDKKEIQLKITDKSQKKGLTTKNIFLIGYPSVVFCTADLRLDEQEATRFLLLSPEINQEKIRAAILEKVKREVDKKLYQHELENNVDREFLIRRIIDIKKAGITQIQISNPKRIQELFLSKIILKPRHQRDIGRILSIIKTFALLNFWFRKRKGDTIIANEEDIDAAFSVWDKISESQELNLPPYIFNLYKEIIFPAFQERNSESHGGVTKYGLTKQDILAKHYKTHGRYLPDWQYRQQIIPMLESSGLISLEPDPMDKRKLLIFCPTELTNSQPQRNSESGGRVNPQTELL